LNPSFQRKAQIEVDSFISEEKYELSSLEEVGNLKYLEMCWKEAMRLHTPLPFIGRKLSEEITLGSLVGVRSNIYFDKRVNHNSFFNLGNER
jgi:cytochrome P450